MKNLIALVLLLTAGIVLAAPSPIPPAVYKEITKVKNNSNPMVRLDFDARTIDRAAAAVVYANDVIPGDSIITDVKIYVDNILTSTNDNTVAVGCEAANDLFAATDLSDAQYATNYIVQGIPTGATAAMVYSDGCTPKVTVGAGASGITDGRLIVFIKYIPIE